VNLWQKFQRAEYQSQPLQLYRRFWRIASGATRRSRVRLRLPWGLPIRINPRESIGRSIVALNTLDLPVTEAIWRLLDDGATCADVGANIGYMTSVMAARLHAGGTIHSFEPVPELADELQGHVDEWRQHTRATLHVHRLAMGEKSGNFSLYLPPDFAENRGLAMLPDSARPREQAEGARELVVRCERMDEFFAALPRLDLIKVDVEGCEQQVFRGAEGLLRSGRIRDIIFEEYDPAPRAGSIAEVRRHGYTLVLVARSKSGPVLLPADAALPDDFDPPTFLSTLDPRRARERFAGRGWLSLRPGVR
jgi:FkbM family methyltransferase